jgi:hypothetical protein
MLIRSKFEGYKAGIRVYPGKDGGSAPAAPDYAAAAKDTAAGNLEMAKYTTRANRINQYTPYGSLTYSRKQPTFDQAGYDKAMQNYQNSLSGQGQSRQTGTFGPQTISVGNDQQTVWGGFNPDLPDTTGIPGFMLGGQARNDRDSTSSSGSFGGAPRREDFMLPDDGGGWEQRMELTPQAQATLDKQMALSDKYAETAGIGFDKARSIFENPQIDESLLPQRAIDIGKTAQEALLSRIEPNLLREDEALRTRLANQGIGLGSTAYGREMALQGQKGTDLRLQAALQGINLDQANRAAALNEAYTAQSRPLDLISALRTGAQVNNPQFQGFSEQRFTGGPDLLNAANQQYGAQMDAYNADQAASSGLLGGIAGVGLGLAGLPGAGGSILKGAKGLFG